MADSWIRLYSFCIYFTVTVLSWSTLMVAVLYESLPSASTLTSCFVGSDSLPFWLEWCYPIWCWMFRIGYTALGTVGCFLSLLELLDMLVSSILQCTLEMVGWMSSLQPMEHYGTGADFLFFSPIRAWYLVNQTSAAMLENSGYTGSGVPFLVIWW